MQNLTTPKMAVSNAPRKLSRCGDLAVEICATGGAHHGERPAGAARREPLARLAKDAPRKRSGAARRAPWSGERAGGLGSTYSLEERDLLHDGELFEAGRGDVEPLEHLDGDAGAGHAIDATVHARVAAAAHTPGHTGPTPR